MLHMLSYIYIVDVKIISGMYIMTGEVEVCDEALGSILHAHERNYYIAHFIRKFETSVNKNVMKGVMVVQY